MLDCFTVVLCHILWPEDVLAQAHPQDVAHPSTIILDCGVIIS